MYEKSIFCQRLSQALTDKQMKPIALSRRCGINKSTISQYLAGKYIPKQDNITLIAHALDVSPLWLMGYDDGDAESVWLKNHAGAVDKICRLPVVGRVSAGPGVFADTDIIDYEICDTRFDDGEHFFLTVTGDSMSPALDNGDRVLVHRQNWLENGEVGVFLVDGEDGIIKKFECEGQTLRLISFNPVWPVRPFTGSEMERVHIIGRVIRSVKSW